jgi:hypothetical protein
MKSKTVSRKDAKTQRISMQEDPGGVAFGREKWCSWFGQAVHNPADPIFHQWRTKVEQKTKPQPCKSQVGEHLFGMNLSDLIEGLEFQNDFVFNKDVGPETFVEPDVAIHDGHGDLSLNLQSSPFQFFG